MSSSAQSFTHHGETLIPGYNVDRLNIAAGMRLAAKFGFDSPEDQMVVEYALMRHRRGEEDGCEKTMLSHGIDLTSIYAIRAAAMAGAVEPELINPDFITDYAKQVIDGAVRKQRRGNFL